jgi:hypothetical protein
MSINRFSAAVLIALVAVAGCASAPKLPVFGDWRVASFNPIAAPGAPAEKPAAAPVQTLAWVGVSASFTPRFARFGGDRCSAPTYTRADMPAAEFQKQFHVSPASLGITADPVPVYRLECGYQWGGQTNTLIVKSPTSLLAPWDDTFFELEKRAPGVNESAVADR